MENDPRCTACAAPPDGAFAKDGFTYLVCSACGSAWLDPQPEIPARLYDRSYFSGGGNGGYTDYAADADLHRINARRRLDAAGVSPPGRVIDVGSAYGYALDAAVGRGFDAIGVDVSSHARVEAARRGHTVVAALDDVAPGSASLVLFTQVLEHMPDPHAAVITALRILRPGGSLLIETWDRASLPARMLGTRWHQVTPPSVLHLWTREGLRQLLARVDVSDVAVRRWTKRVSLGWAGGIAAEKSALALGLDRGARAVRLDRAWLPYGLGDLVLITARKS